MTGTSVALAMFAVVALGILAILASLLLAASWLSARGSGWSELAERYAASQEPSGQVYMRQHSQLGSVRYRNCTTIGVSSHGLYLAVTAPVISQHPPLLIPWNSITGVRPTRLYWQSAMQLSVGRPQVTTITVMRGMYEHMKPFLDSTLI